MASYLDQEQVTISSIPLPTGAATEATLQLVVDALNPNDQVLYNETLSVLPNTESVIVSYSVPLLGPLYIKHVSASATNVSEFYIRINGTVIAKMRSYYTDLNVKFFFESDTNSGIQAPAGSLVEICGKSPRPTNTDFNATLVGRI
jgi:hypothetical protein